MSSNKTQSSVPDITIRAYQTGDEARIVDFLNLCYGQWGTVSKWQGLYREYPNFDKDNVFIFEENGEIVGHRGLHFRNMVVRENYEVSTATVGDTAIHPCYQGFGLYTRLQEITLEAARLKGACLAFSWNLRGAATYKHNKKTGFTEVIQTPAYMKIVKPEKVLKAGLFDLIRKNQRLRKTLQEWGDNLCFRLDKTEFSIAELLGEASQKPQRQQKKVLIIFRESALPLLTNFRYSGKFQRIRCLAQLVLRRQAKVRTSSFGAFLKLLSMGVRVLASL